MSTSFAARYDMENQDDIIWASRKRIQASIVFPSLTIHDHPNCEVRNLGEHHVELTDNGNCRSCYDKWWDELL